ncbi:MAG: CPBP family intramembrane metalloprotease [Crocinitomicaceae bacterium]|nr:CPBP family intramembrane metalloprotease [Crocinitomicaceae bacterium]
MNFLEQSEKDKRGGGMYLLTLILVFLTFVYGMSMSAYVAEIHLGFSLVDKIPEDQEAIAFGLQLLPFVLGFAVLLLCIKFLNKRPIRTAFTSRERFDWRRFFAMFTVWGGILTIFLCIGFAMHDPIEFQFNAGKFFPLLFFALILIPIQTTTEDLMFRGYLFQGLATFTKSGMMSLLILGAIFGYLHMGNPEVELLGNGIVIYYISSGVFMGILSYLDDGIELGMGYHVANNLFGVLILSTDWQVFKTNSLFLDHTPPSFGWDLIISLIVLQPAIIFLFYKIYKWKGVKEKLLK